MSNPTVVSDIAPTDAATVVDTSAALLVDVREDREWAAGHSPNAIHIPLGRLDPTSLPTDRPIITICRSGGRSGQAAAILAGAGYRVSNLTGGMQAWAAAGLPVVATDGTPGAVA